MYPKDHTGNRYACGSHANPLKKGKQTEFSSLDEGVEKERERPLRIDALLFDVK